MQLASGGDWPPPAANTMVKTQGAYIHIYGSDFTRLRETWFSKKRSTKKFQAPFRQVGGLELFGRTMLAFLLVCVSIYLLCKS